MCEIKVVGPVKVADVCVLLPTTEFALEHIAVEDQRLDTTSKRDVYALAMTREEFEILLAVVGGK